MEMAATKTLECSFENNMKTVYNMLDEAIDDYENGRLLTEDEFWKGIFTE